MAIHRFAAAAATAAATTAVGVSPERPGGGSGGSGTSSPAPVGGSGGGFTLPDPVVAPTPPDAAVTQCAAEAHKAEIVPLDLMLLVDSLGIDDQLGRHAHASGRRRTEVLRNFVADPKSAGLGMGLQFFPTDKPCTTDKDCLPTSDDHGTLLQGQAGLRRPDGSGTDAAHVRPTPVIIIGPIGTRCAAGQTCQPVGYCSSSGAACIERRPGLPDGGRHLRGVDQDLQQRRRSPPSATTRATKRRRCAIDALPMAQPALTRALNRKEPTGGTPMGPAIRGVLKHLQARQQANPGRKVALILASDGLPGGCTRNDIPSIAMDLNAAFMATPSIPTYVIGVFSPTELARAQPQLDQLAMGGGTNTAFVLTANDDLNMRLLEALNQIRGAALACEYQIPAPDEGRSGLRQGERPLHQHRPAPRTSPTSSAWIAATPCAAAGTTTSTPARANPPA